MSESYLKALANGVIYKQSLTLYVCAADSDDEFLRKVLLEELAEACHRVGARVKVFGSYAVSSSDILRGQMEGGKRVKDPE